MFPHHWKTQTYTFILRHYMLCEHNLFMGVRICTQVVHLLGHGALEDDDKAPFTVESGGGSDLARITSSLRHDTAYKPHEVGRAS